MALTVYSSKINWGLRWAGTKGGGEGGEIGVLTLGQGSGGRGHQGSPAHPWWRLWAGDPEDQVAPKAWEGPALAPGVSMDGKILFSNLIVVFQLQKEMREGVCVCEFVCECLPRRASKCSACEKCTHEQAPGEPVGVSGRADLCTCVTGVSESSARQCEDATALLAGSGGLFLDHPAPPPS